MTNPTFEETSNAFAAVIRPYPPFFESLTLYFLKKVNSPLPVFIIDFSLITLSSKAAIIAISLKVEPGSFVSPTA